jgi:anthranilate phosphoribosyltransferase
VKDDHLSLQEIIGRLESGNSLSRSEAESVCEELLSGRLAEDAVVRLLSALRDKGESVDEIVGFATAMRRHAAKIFPQPRVAEDALVDTCGTGGSPRTVFNISTAAAFVVAGAGVRVAKHGNRSNNSRSGSADVLEALGVRVDLSTQKCGEAIESVGISFLFAQTMHTAMRHAAPARKRLGGHTIFNLLGPLTNPAGASAQVVGVSAAKWVGPLAQALAQLGSKRAFVVHGDDGLGEISLSGETQVSEVRDARVKNYKVAPEDFGVVRAPLESLVGSDPSGNAAIIRAILSGEAGPRRDIVVINAAAALVAAGHSEDFCTAAAAAAKSIDSGAGAAKLLALSEFTQHA